MISQYNRNEIKIIKDRYNGLNPVLKRILPRDIRRALNHLPTAEDNWTLTNIRPLVDALLIRPRHSVWRIIRGLFRGINYFEVAGGDFMKGLHYLHHTGLFTELTFRLVAQCQNPVEMALHYNSIRYLLMGDNAEVIGDCIARHPEPVPVLESLTNLGPDYNREGLFTGNAAEANRNVFQCQHPHIMGKALLSLHFLGLLTGDAAQANRDALVQHQQLYALESALFVLRSTNQFVREVAQTYFNRLIRHHNLGELSRWFLLLAISHIATPDRIDALIDHSSVLLSSSVWPRIDKLTTHQFNQLIAISIQYAANPVAGHLALEAYVNSIYMHDTTAIKANELLSIYKSGRNDAFILYYNGLSPEERKEILTKRASCHGEGERKITVSFLQSMVERYSPNPLIRENQEIMIEHLMNEGADVTMNLVERLTDPSARDIFSCALSRDGREPAPLFKKLLSYANDLASLRKLRDSFTEMYFRSKYLAPLFNFNRLLPIYQNLIDEQITFVSRWSGMKKICIESAVRGVGIVSSTDDETRDIANLLGDYRLTEPASSTKPVGDRYRLLNTTLGQICRFLQDDMESTPTP